MNYPNLSTMSQSFGEKLSLRISLTELQRRLWHITPGFLPLLLWPISHADPISPTLRAILILIICGIGISIFKGYRRIARSGADSNELSSVAGYAGSVLFTLLLLPSQIELGFAVLAILAFGDGTATLGGLLLRGPALVWNREKRLSGLLCFILFGGFMASVIYWGEAQNLEAMNNPRVDFRTALMFGFPLAFVCAIVESLPLKINDNIRVGVTAIAMSVLLHWYLTGWA